MASRVGLIMRTAAARDRVDAATAQLSGSGILGPLETQAPRDRDAEVSTMLREEWLADVLEALVAGPPAPPEGDVAEPDDDPRETWANPEFKDMSREDLDKIASDWYSIDPTGYPEDEDLRLALVDAYDRDTGGEPLDEASLLEMKLADLKELAIDRGADKELATKARSKKDVIALMSADAEAEGE